MTSKQNLGPMMFDAVRPNAPSFRPNMLGSGERLVNGGFALGVPLKKAAAQMVRHYEKHNHTRLDAIRERSDLRLGTDEAGFVVCPDGYRFRQRGMSELCSAVGVPWKYVATLPTPLALEALNYTLKQADQKLKLRTALGADKGEAVPEVRGVVGERYSPFDMPEWTEGLQEAIGRMPLKEEPRVLAAYAGATYSVHIGTEKSLRGPDGYSLVKCLKCGNGETGQRAIEVLGGLLRPICRNGMFSYQKIGRLSRRHTGKMDDMGDRMAYDIPKLMAASDDAMTLANRCGQSELTLDQIDGLLDKLDLTSKAKKRVKLVAAAEAHHRAGGGPKRDTSEPNLIDEASEEVYGELEKFMAWDIVNGLTQVAQVVNRRDQRKMESQSVDFIRSVSHLNLSN